MTNTVEFELAKKHMKAMGIRFADGRSDASVKLHFLEERMNGKSSRMAFI